MIRVLHYGMSPNLGGIETFLLNLARMIDSSSFHCDFLYSDHGQRPIFADELAAQGSQFFGVTPRRASPRRNRSDLKALFTGEHFDILHFHANTASYVEPVRAALKHGVPVVYHSHNAGLSRSRITGALHHWNRSTLPWERIVRIAVSSEAGRWMFHETAFRVIHNGINVDEYAFNDRMRTELRASLGIAEDEFVVGSVAAFLPAKNHVSVVEIFTEIHKELSNSCLILVGSGPLEAGIRDIVHRLGHSERVYFLGIRTDIPALLSAMDCLLLPSLHEGFPVVTLEAQASGLPCFISDKVTPEVLISQNSKRIPLTATPSTWATEILSSLVCDRTAGQQALQSAHLTTVDTVAQVEETYYETLARAGR